MHQQKNVDHMHYRIILILNSICETSTTRKNWNKQGTQDHVTCMTEMVMYSGTLYMNYDCAEPVDMQSQYLMVESSIDQKKILHTM